MLIVQKFGGSWLADVHRLRRAAEIGLRARREGNDVIIVVSAMGESTDELLRLAQEIDPAPSAREMDALLSTGEQRSAALLAITLESLGQPARSFAAWQAGLVAGGDYGDGRVGFLLPGRLTATLEEGAVAVVCGFQAVNAAGDIITLGRGGSDTTAVALAAGLHADRCEIYTDVDGIYTADPRLLPEARRLSEIDGRDMLRLARAGSQVLHDRSVELALARRVPIRLLSAFEEGEGSLVCLLPAERRPDFAGLTRNAETGTVTLVGKAADAAALSAAVMALAEKKIPALGGSVGDGSVSVRVPPERLDETMHLIHGLFLS